MSKKNRVIVRILGQEYPLMSEDSREYMQKVAYVVDDRMNALIKSNNKLSTSMVAVLTALNLADECLKCTQDKEKLEKKVEELINAIEKPSLNGEKDEITIIENSEEPVECNEPSLEEGTMELDQAEVQPQTENDDVPEETVEEDLAEQAQPIVESEPVQQIPAVDLEMMEAQMRELKGRVDYLSEDITSRDDELSKTNELIKNLEAKLTSKEQELSKTQVMLKHSKRELDEFIRTFDEQAN